jgi:hypothetical protein
MRCFRVVDEADQRTRVGVPQLEDYYLP